jgi:hypothetical protein
MTLSRREVIKFLSAISGWRMFPFLQHGAAYGRPLTPTSERASVGTALSGSGNQLGPTYKDLGYKLFILDFQFSDLDPDTMKYADAEKIADAMAEMGVESHLVYAITNTGFALYKSQFAPKFKNLPDDFLGDYLAACRKRGIKTVLYYSWCWQRILDVDHSDWAVQDANSKPVQIDTAPYGFMGKTNWLCVNSPFQELALKQVKEIADRYTFDSFFVDVLCWERDLVCYNPSCLEKWKARTGQDLPRPLPDELYPQYLDFTVETYRSAYQAIKDQLKASGREVPITHNGWNTYEYIPDDYVVRESNPRGSDFYETSVYAKLYRALAHGRELQMLPHLNNHVLDYVHTPVPELRWQTAIILSHNAAVMAGQQANVDGTVDATTVRNTKEALQVADRLIPKVRGTIPYAEVAILASERDQMLTDNRSFPDFYGANKLLTDLHWPFDVVTAEHLSSTDLSSFPLLIVPNVQHLSAQPRQVVLEYLRKGGHLFFSGRCAVLDENGKPHLSPNFGLVKIQQETQAPRGYIKTSFPIDDERLKAAQIMIVEPDAKHKVWARLIQLSATRREGSPLEDVAYPLRETDLPVIVAGEEGKGNFTYVGYRFFEEYLNQTLPVIGRVFTHLVTPYFEPVVRVEAPTVVEAIYNQKGSELRVSLVNGITGRPSGGQTSDTELFGRVNIVEVIPVLDTKILLRGRKVRQATNLAGEQLHVTMEQGNTVIRVPRLEQYDVVTVELG